jgi:Reverse transcriptase (RNA-dependent DNA polymerase)
MLKLPFYIQILKKKSPCAFQKKYILEVHNTKVDSNTHVLLLKKAIYGLVQAARQWWKKFKEVMAMCNYFRSKSDRCIFIKKAKEDEPLFFVIIYVDDGGIFATPDAIKEVISALGKYFKVKTLIQFIRMVSGYIYLNSSKI